jgi:hypothetical protein
MNSTNVTRVVELDPWVESGAMVYVALTVATFSALIMCCTWFFKEYLSRPRQYTSIGREEHIELTVGGKDQDSGEEEISLSLSDEESSPMLSPTEILSSTVMSSGKEPDDSAFSLDDDSDDEKDHEEDTLTTV